MKKNNLLTRLTAACLAVLMVPILSGCRNAPPTNAPNRPTARFDVFDPNTGRMIATGEDNRGQTALGNGQAFDTTEVELLREIELSGDGPNGLTILRATRSAALAANVEQINKLDAKRKETAQAAVDALKAGLEQDYARLIGEVGALGKEIAQLVAEGGKGAGGDNKATTLLLATTAPNQAAMVETLARAGEVALTVESGNRPSVKTTSDVRTEDTTTEAETLKMFGVIENIGTNYVGYLTAKLKAAERDSEDLAKLEPAPEKKPTQPGNVGDNVSAEVRANAWYPNTPRGGGNTEAVAAGVGKVFLWKPVSDSNGKAAVHTANHHYVEKIEVVGADGAVIESHSVGAIGNGWRPLFRLSKPGGAYPGPVKVRHLPSGYTVTVAEPGKRTSLNGTPAFAPVGPEQDPTGDPLPPPTGIINDGPTNTVTNAVIRAASANSITLAPAINARAVRVQVVHTRNGFHPAFNVSGVKGVGEANGFQWINLGWNASGVYTAPKALLDYPKGKRGDPVWLVTSRPGMGGKPFYADGNFVVTASGQYVPKG